MTISNYTTSIAAAKTLSEIQQLLASKGASGIQIDYAAGLPVALTFAITVNGRQIAFRLPSRHEGVLKALKRDPKVRPSLKTDDQALRVSWRIIKDWVTAQLAIIEADLATLAEVFLPYAVGNDGRTVYEQFEQHGFPLLAAPKE